MSSAEPHLRIQVARTTAELEALEPAWRALWHLDPQATPFQRPEWLLPWWGQFGRPDLRAVTVREGGELVALLPLYIYADPRSGTRQLLLLGAGTSDYLDGLCAPGCTPAHLQAALAAVAAEPDWDVAELTQLRPQSPLRRALQATGAEHAGEGCSRCAALPVAGLPTKLRAQVRYLHNAAGGRSRLRCDAAPAGELPEAFDALVRLHTERWQQAGESGVLADPLVLAWHREALPRLAACGLLRLYVLRRDGEIIAVLYALTDPAQQAPQQRTAYFYLMGYAAELHTLRPGTLITALAMEHAAAEGFAAVDMLRGNESYKKFWRMTPAPTFGFSLPRYRLAAAALP